MPLKNSNINLVSYSQNNLSQNLKPTPNIKKIAIAVAVGAFVFLVTITSLVLVNDKKTNSDLQEKDVNLAKLNKVIIPKTQKTQISQPVTPASLSFEPNLQPVDPVKLKQDYQNGLKGIIAELDQSIQSSGGIGRVDIAMVEKIKTQALEEIVPKESQSLHLDLILVRQR